MSCAQIFVPLRSIFMKISEYIPYYRRNLKVAFPVMLTQVGAALTGLFDSIMVGHYATTDFAAVSFSNALFFTFMVFGMGAIMGVTPLVGYEVGQQELGEDRTSNIASWLQNGLWFTLMVSALMVLILGGCIPLLNYFGQDPEVITAARPYYILIVLSIIPFLMYCLCKQFLEGLGNTMVAMVISIGMNLLNIGLNWIFIFGRCGFEPMGATGAGIATLISRLLMPILFIVVIWCKKNWRVYIQLFCRERTSRTQIRELVRIGAPIGMQSVLEAFIFTASFVFVGWISKEALAAHQVANQIADLTFMLATGIGAATTIRVSIQLGRGDLHAVKMASNASIHLVLLINTIGALLMISLRELIPCLFTEDIAVREVASTLLLFAGMFQLADGMQCVGAGMLRGIQDVKWPMVMAFIAYIVIALPIGLLCMFTLDMGPKGMWVGFIVGLSLAAILFHTRFRKKTRKMEIKFGGFR